MSDSLPTNRGLTFNEVDLSIEENDLWIHFTFGKSYRFDNAHHLFEVLRDAYSKHLNGTFLMIKFASRWEGYNAPVLHNPADLVTALDPLLAYRDPVIDVQRTLAISLLKCESRPFYYRKKSSMEELQAVRARIASQE